LANQAMSDGLPILVMRGAKDWIAAIPELAEYPHRFGLRSRNVAISRGNMEEGKFDELIARLRSKPRRTTVRRGT